MIQKSGMFLLLLSATVLASVLTLRSPARAAAPAVSPQPAARLGMNLSGMADWNSELPFVDEFHLARVWVSQKQGVAWGKGPPLLLDSHGWVKKLQPGCWAETIMFTGLHGHYPAGRYTVLYDGKGELTLDYGSCKIIRRRPGKIIVRVNPIRGPLTLQIRKTDPADYIRDIRVIIPGFAKTYKTQIFRPGFLRMWRGVRCFRFMDWMATNNSKITSWTERARTDDATWTTRGVPLSIMIDLCNREKVDAWFNMPVGADDNYIRHFAAQVKAQLDPSLKVYIEYSNEVWNGGFRQNSYAEEKAKGLHLGNPSLPWEGGCLYYVRRSLQIFKIWQQVFGPQEKTRLVRVLAWQAASSPSYWLDGLLLSHTRPGQVDALAIAPYITFNVDPKMAPKVAGWSVQKLLGKVDKQVLPQAERWMVQDGRGARKYHLKLLAYEAGQSLVGVGGGENNPKLTLLFEKANAASAMGKIYTEYLRFWQAHGGGLLNNFASVNDWGKWGCWGLLRHYNDNPADSPKFMAVMRWAKALGQKVNLPGGR